ncbi:MULTISPECIES: CAP domain-containing protein [unclassified Blastococcus]
MHHLPTGPSLSARLAASLRRRAALLSGAGICVAVVGVVLAALLFYGGAAGDTATVDASSDGDPGTAAGLESGGVRIGVDGAPAAEGTAPDGTATVPLGTPTPGTSAVPGTPAPGTTTPGTPTPGTTAPGGTGPVPTTPGSTAPGTSPGTTAGTPPAPAPGSTAPGSTAPGSTAPGSTAPGSAPGTPSSAGSTGAGAPAPPPAAAAPAGPVEQQVLALVNRERAAAGCGAVVADAGLAAVARAHSADMRDRGYFDHTDPDGRDPFDRAAAAGQSARAENIARGQADAAAVMASWMDSPGHRANILDCGLTRLGVGVAEGPGGPWWTQLFG